MKFLGIRSVLILVLAISAFAIPAFAQDGRRNVIIHGGDADTLKDLVVFLVSDAGPIHDDMKIDVYVADLPAESDDLPFELSYPEDANIIGSVILTNGTSEKYYRPDYIYFETALTPDEVQAFYADALADHFEVIGYMGPNMGFVDSKQPIYQSYCFEDKKSQVSIMASEGVNVTDVEIAILKLENMPAEGSCGGPPEMESSRNVYNIMPALTAPDDVSLQLQNTSGSYNQVTSSASLATEELAVSDLVVYYQDLVEQAEWEVLTSDIGDDGGWFTASLEEDGTTWLATMTIIANPLGEGSFDATFSILMK